jgi:hypothetical protein
MTIQKDGKFSQSLIARCITLRASSIMQKNKVDSIYYSIIVVADVSLVLARHKGESSTTILLIARGAINMQGYRIL